MIVGVYYRTVVDRRLSVPSGRNRRMGVELVVAVVQAPAGR